jgi:hypothetical protein
VDARRSLGHPYEPQGTTTRNLTETGGATASGTTNKMEGTAAALFASNTLQTAMQRSP